METGIIVAFLRLFQSFSCSFRFLIMKLSPQTDERRRRNPQSTPANGNDVSVGGGGWLEAAPHLGAGLTDVAMAADSRSTPDPGGPSVFATLAAVSAWRGKKKKTADLRPTCDHSFEKALPVESQC